MNLIIYDMGNIGIAGMIPPELDGANLTENAARPIPNELTEFYPRYLMYCWLRITARPKSKLSQSKTPNPSSPWRGSSH